MCNAQFQIGRLMASKEFISQRIAVYAGKPIDPDSDKQVEEMLRSKFNIHLPQRRSMNESLSAAISDHEILKLLIEYRLMTP
jgi:DNA polymerase I-like protein with 3'-5' exonuclease and polymerase domains